MTITLRPYQVDAVDQSRKAWDDGAQVVMYQGPTGSGKTEVTAHIFGEHDGAWSLTAHRSELIGQLSLALAKRGVKHDLICSTATRRIIAALHVQTLGACYLVTGHRGRVSSVDTLIRAKGIESWAAQVSLWGADEGHHCCAAHKADGTICTDGSNKWGKSVALFPRTARGFLPTATPWRGDGKGLGRHADGLADVLIEGPTPRWLIEQGYLTDYDVVCPPSDMQILADVAASGDWSPKVLKEASQRSHITGDVVSSYRKFAWGKIGATFATDVETATLMAAAYRAAGVAAEVLTGETDPRLRASILARLERREIWQICVVDIISEGTDLPALEVITMARPTMSLSLYLQIFGRVLRTMYALGFDITTQLGRLAAIAAGSKPRALLIDHVGNFVRHQGGPDAPRVWTLDRRERRSKGASDAESLRVCTECFKPFKRVMTACPHCGAEIPPPAGRAGPEQVDGDLALLSPEVLAALRADLPESEAGYRERLMATGLPEVPLRANMRRHRERLDALAALRLEMAVWSGRLHAAGMSDREIHKAWFLHWGGTVFDALSLSRADAVALTARVKEDNDV